MSIINRQSNHTNNQSGFAKTFVVIIIIILLLALAVGYLAYAKNKNMWPFNTEAVGSSSTVDSTQSNASVKINKLSFENEVLTVGVKLNNVADKGHCVLIVSGKTTGLTIDDSKAQRSDDAAANFKDCVGWSVGVNNLPSGEYNVEVKYIGSNEQLSTTEKITKK